MFLYVLCFFMFVFVVSYVIIFFFFLFVVMFGDFGYGFIMFLVGFWMVIIEKKFIFGKLDNEVRLVYY